MSDTPGNYRIIGVPQEIASVHPELNTVVNGKQVHAIHNDSNAHAKVFIPNDEYGPDNVDAKLRHEFRKHHRVMGLGYDTTPES